MNRFYNNDRWVWIIAILALFPALFLNLGVMPLNSDGGLRGLTAIEMVLNDDYIVPTQNGMLYYKKPPVFNWMIVASSWITGDFSNFTIRFPVSVSVLLLGLILFFLLKKSYPNKVAGMLAFMGMTCGHVLFASSLNGRIDISFSMLILANFLLLHHWYKKGNLWQLFIGTYAIMALAFLTKSIPAIIFQGFTLLTWFIYNRDLKRFFSLPHIVGGLLGLSIIGVYYLLYARTNYDNLGELFFNLWHDSEERTLWNFPIAKIFSHLGLFWPKFLYEILPWSILLIMLFQKNIWQKIKAESLILYSILVIAANIIIYWVSPGNNSRYLIMFFPLAILIPAHFYFSAKADSQLKKIVDSTFQVLIVLAAIGVWVFPFLPDFKGTSLLPLVLFSLILGTIAWFYFKMPMVRMLWMAVAILVIRTVFNVVVFPVATELSSDAKYRDYGEKVAELTLGNPLAIYKNTTINSDLSTYITRGRWAILPRHKEQFDLASFYIVDIDHLKMEEEKNVQFEIFYEFTTRHAKTPLYLVKFKETP